ncbi:MAG TPA: S46 family peptidase, partial [Flavobacteriales bacterium]|nr:S46 family peptidase [Flavobacteriales bacterium]
WPDANSTLRLSYGKVEGSEPYDGVVYKPFTTLRGIMEKYKPGDAEFDVPKKLLDIYAAKDFAPYGSDTDMPVCFTSSLHTTGGNSGSPVFNGRGELIGLNFDRTWESTMSDILFDPEKCRNIAVDIRYVLWVVDKVCGGKRLVDELELVRLPSVPSMIELPIHR